MKRPLLLSLLVITLLSGCLGQSPATTPQNAFSQYELGYRLLDNHPDFFWCDPHFWPIVREGQEQQDALKDFPSIRANDAEFAAILDRISMDNKDRYTDEEQLLIFRQHKLLTIAVQMTPAANGYGFTLRVKEGQGERLEGTITTAGKVTVEKREPSFNTCPICLVKGTLIDTPDGAVRVEDIRKGATVWTLNDAGERVAANVLATSSTPVPTSFQVVFLTLDDGRTVMASPGHPTDDGRALGDCRVGGTLDGAVVVQVDLIPYEGGKTYDLLPSGDTGLYWANGIQLGSTLAR
ncbi:MAG: hypothetical protein A2147_08515 [Chloroflexi bacterium RBG_16_57_8]|nr:MAG: hypothetical protein A2147_08515 [Chloroflexi bacterium RBG_16_57_8]